MTQSGIATIDLTPLVEGLDGQDQVVSNIMAACRDIGFLCIVGTGVAPELIKNMRDAVRRVFAVDEQEKWDQAITRENYRGYIPLSFFTPNDGSGTADKYEGYKLHRETAPDDPIRQDCALYGPNLWPKNVTGVAEAVLAYWAEMDRVTSVLLAALETGLGIPTNALQSNFKAPLTNMTLLHYPAQDGDGFGIHPHKDTDALTILAGDQVAGLMVRCRDEEAWIDVDPPANALVVNIGDMR